MRLFPKVAKLKVFVVKDGKTSAADLSGFDFEFTVSAKLPTKEKGKTKTHPVYANVVIRGLNEDTREKLSAEKTAILLEYGYGDEVFEIFEGLNVNVINDFQGPGWKTEIFAKHGWDAYKNSFFSRSYEDETPVSVVLDDVLKSFGLPITNLYERDDKIIGGAFFDGESKTVLDGLCADYDLNWRIENNSIVLGDSLNPPLVERTKVVVLGPSITAGPSVEETLEDEGGKDEKVVRKVSATSILLPQLWPGVPVRFDVESFQRSGGAMNDKALKKFDSEAIFICDSVSHKGGSRAVPGTTDISTRPEVVK